MNKRYNPADHADDVGVIGTDELGVTGPQEVFPAPAILTPTALKKVAKKELKAKLANLNKDTDSHFASLDKATATEAQLRAWVDESEAVVLLSVSCMHEAFYYSYNYCINCI